MTSEQLALSCAAVASDKKGEGISILNVGAISDIADYFVICSGTSTRQIKTIADAISTHSKSLDNEASIEGYTQAHWIVIDLGDVVIHLFTNEYRLYYGLESLWRDAPTLSLDGTTEKISAPEQVVWSSKRRR